MERHVEKLKDHYGKNSAEYQNRIIQSCINGAGTMIQNDLKRLIDSQGETLKVHALLRIAEALEVINDNWCDEHPANKILLTQNEKRNDG